MSWSSIGPYFLQRSYLPLLSTGRYRQARCVKWPTGRFPVGRLCNPKESPTCNDPHLRVNLPHRPLGALGTKVGYTHNMVESLLHFVVAKPSLLTGRRTAGFQVG
ncbi:unnamed protein product [Protopolystoma xenopodis]|uniref:Uncharacterized protein n=1 Tax=Protopolystoma xenopodis TaxID=117903 RepID=A0A448WSU1_9PLAT|nr:unnamed protein product [Protopolystoma xenopodis]